MLDLRRRYESMKIKQLQYKERISLKKVLTRRRNDTAPSEIMAKPLSKTPTGRLIKAARNTRVCIIC